MKNIKFTIKGNQEDKDGNPIPYHRVTRNTLWTARAVRYSEWKSYVAKQLHDHYKTLPKTRQAVLKELFDFSKDKPINKTNRKIAVMIKIVYKSKTHGDSDNIFKGIADSIFQDDKYVIGSFDFSYGKVGQVDVEIIFL